TRQRRIPEQSAGGRRRRRTEAARGKHRAAGTAARQPRGSNRQLNRAAAELPQGSAAGAAGLKAAVAVGGVFGTVTQGRFHGIGGSGNHFFEQSGFLVT